MSSLEACLSQARRSHSYANSAAPDYPCGLLFPWCRWWDRLLSQRPFGADQTSRDHLATRGQQLWGGLLLSLHSPMPAQGWRDASASRQRRNCANSDRAWAAICLTFSG